PAALVLASVQPSATPTRDWNEEVVFTLTVADGAGRPVPGITLLVQDGLRNLSSVTANLTADATGQLTFRSTVPSGQADGRYPFTFQATKPGFGPSPVATREVQVRHAGFSATGAPTIMAQPAAQSVTAGARATFAVSALGAPTLAYQWRFKGADLAGATTSSLALAAVTAAQSGDYAVTVTNPAGSVTSLVAPLSVNPSAWLSNVSLRTNLTTGQNVIVGFVVNGGSKEILVRAAGPALASFGLTAAMGDPRLELYRETAKVAENNDWPAALAPTVLSLGAFPFPVASRDAAFLQSLGGPHTVQATGTTGGIILIEGYDAGTGSAARLVNLSARNRVGTGADILIAGFSIAGTGTQRVLIRAVGPTLASFGVSGVLADPQLELTDAAGSRIATNDNWDASLAPAFTQVGAFPLPAGSKDAAVVATVTAGRSYTVQVSGLSNGVGEALVEVYELP
ncbi:MAG: immunoglobulin domain-containing protein, partial [Verrucomicrobia bacterium]|nr:immunoglobulin domain-containing protein [Verrucomicrobiota bacterium]